MVRFGSGGYWKHAANNGQWQFDFNVIVLKDYEVDTRTSEMVFDTMPLDKRTKGVGKVMENWLGEVVKVDVDKDGSTRVNISRSEQNLLCLIP